jgi:ribA/ribD-fused uncharacterized protein
MTIISDFTTTPINGFKGEHSFLSNFAPCEIIFEDFWYPSTEHAYVAAKTLDKNIRANISSIVSPGAVKRFGRSLIVRDDWNSIKLDVMAELIHLKFEQKEFKDKLLATGTSYIEETNTWGDVFWGVCRGRGGNHLGKILMRERAFQTQK